MKLLWVKISNKNRDCVSLLFLRVYRIQFFTEYEYFSGRELDDWDIE